MFSITDGFLISSIIYYLYKIGCINKLLSGGGINNKIVPQIIIDILVFKGILSFLKVEKKYFFSRDFLNKFNYIELGKIITLVGGYGENFINLKKVLDTNNYYKSSINIGKGSMYSGFKLNMKIVSRFLSKKSKGTVIDLGCGSGDFLSILARKYLNLNFVGIDLSEDTIRKAKKNNNIKNLNFICGNILDEKIYNGINNVILLTGFFVFHELIGKLDNYIYFLSKTYPLARIIIREFTPPNDIKKLDGFDDNFLASYLLFHNISGQKTYSIKKWIKSFKKGNINLYNIIHTEKFDNNLSLYPLLEFHIGK